MQEKRKEIEEERADALRGEEDDDLLEGVPSGGERESPEDEPDKKVIRLTHSGETERLDVVLSSRVPDYSRAYLQRLIQTGYVTLELSGRAETRPSTKIRDGESIRVVIPPPLKLRLKPEPIPIEILYEDQYLAVVRKPAGLSVHPAPDQVGATLVNALLYWVKDLSGIAGVERPGIVHRLDKETSGVLVIAKNDRAHHGLAAQFKERKVHKRYLAIARGEPAHWEGRIDYAIGRSPRHSKKMVICQNGSGRSSLTDYRVLEKFRGYALLECFPLTGRTHQIRVHLAHLRMPVACDKLYGREKRIYLSDLRGQTREADEEPIIERHALHAASITFRHPVTQEEMTYNAPLEDDMLALLHGLQRHRSPR